MYTKYAIKECNPKETYYKCLSIMDKHDLFNKGLVNYININYKIKKDFNCYVSKCNIDFGPIFDFEEITIKQAGKGFSYEQCMASLYMEAFERLSLVLSLNENVDLSEDIDIDSLEPSIQKMIKNSELLQVAMKDYLESTIKPSIDIEKIQDKNIVFENLIDGNKILLPNTISYFNISDGTSTGNSKEEAILGGIYEVVERYSVKAFLENRKDIESKKINLDNIGKEIPEIAETLEKITNFSKMKEVSLIEIRLKGTNIYTYIFFCKTNGEYSKFGAGAHSIKRIGVMRAISELIQTLLDLGTFDIDTFGKNTNRGITGNVYISNYFSTNIIERKLREQTKESKFQKEKFEINNIKDLLETTIQEIKNIGIKTILTKDITQEKIGMPVYMVKIPEFGVFWCLKYNNFFYKIENIEKNFDIFPYNIDGLRQMFYYTKVGAYERRNFPNRYYMLLSFLEDENLQKHITENFGIIFDKKNSDKEKEYYNSYNYYESEGRIKIEKQDPDSFIYFSSILKKEKKSLDDFLYLFELYCSIGWIDYAVSYIKDNNIDINRNKKFKEVYDEYFNKTHQLAKIGGELSMFKESAFLFQKLDMTIANAPDEWLE